MMKKIYLQVETPSMHIPVEIIQVRIICHGLIEFLPSKMFCYNFSKGGFANPNIPGNSNKWIINQACLSPTISPSSICTNLTGMISLTSLGLPDILTGIKFSEWPIKKPSSKFSMRTCCTDSILFL